MKTRLLSSGQFWTLQGLNAFLFGALFLIARFKNKQEWERYWDFIEVSAWTAGLVTAVLLIGTLAISQLLRSRQPDFVASLRITIMFVWLFLCAATSVAVLVLMSLFAG